MLAVALAVAFFQTPAPSAQKLFDESVAKANAAHSVSARLMLTMKDDKLSQSGQMDVLAEKPNRFRFILHSAGQEVGQYVWDGVNMYSLIGNTYSKGTAGDQLFAFEMGPAFASFLKGTPANWKVLPDPPKSVVFEGRPAQELHLALDAKQSAQVEYFLEIDPVSLLPLGTRQETPARHATVTVIFQDLQFNPAIAADAFEFTPPPGAKESRGIDADLIKAGTVAPAFATTSASGLPVSLESALKGHKALVLNFWFYG